MEKKAHLHFEGLEQITKIANAMNTKGITSTTQVIQETLVQTTRIEEQPDLFGTDSIE